MAGLDRSGWPEVEVLYQIGLTNGAMRTMSYTDPEGRRQDTAHIYLHPGLRGGKYPNLHVLAELNVEQVLLEDQRAVSVVYRPNPEYQSSNASGGNCDRIIRARRLVSLNCGPLYTALLLQRSGIGDSKILRRAGIKVVADLPGVGSDYDHQSITYIHKSNLSPAATLDAFNAFRMNLKELVAKKDKLMGWNSVDIQAKVRLTDAEITGLGPGFREAWDKEFKNVLDKPFMMMSPVGC